eukprot:m.441303 g.441303  ORF g.441303 m.441303 type:complete len:66 (+) comp20281_c5_seq1:889-1086(+)
MVADALAISFHGYVSASPLLAALRLQQHSSLYRAMAPGLELLAANKSCRKRATPCQMSKGLREHA